MYVYILICVSSNASQPQCVHVQNHAKEWQKLNIIYSLFTPSGKKSALAQVILHFQCLVQTNVDLMPIHVRCNTNKRKQKKIPMLMDVGIKRDAMLCA